MLEIIQQINQAFISTKVLDMGCYCSMASFSSFFLYFVALVIISILILKGGVRHIFFLFLLTGITFSAISEGIDFFQNMAVVHTGMKFYSPTLDIFTSLFQIIGFLFIAGILFFEYWQERKKL